MSYNALNCQTDQTTAAVFTPEQVAVLNQLFGGLQQSQQTQPVPAGFPFPANKSLTATDVGKIVVNKNGTAKVAQRDNLNPGQPGKWQITVNSLFAPPDPAVITIRFDDDPIDDDFIRIAWVTFQFKKNPLGGNDIPIVSGDRLGQIEALTTALAGGGRYSSFWTATHDSVNTVTITINPQWSVFRTTELITEGVLLPPIGAYGDGFDARITNANVNVVTTGNTNDFGLINNDFLTGIGLNLTFYNIFNTAQHPTQQSNFGVYFPVSVNDFASAIASAINRKSSPGLNAVASANVVTIEQTTLQSVPLFQSDSNSKYNYYIVALTGDGSNYCSFTTIANSITPNFASVNDPVLGVLTGLQNGTAYINDASLQQVKLSGVNNVTISPLDNDLNVQLFVNRFCIINNDGTVESLGSVDYIKSQFGYNPDVKTLLQFFSQGCIYWALSGGNVGDTIVVTTNIPVSIYLAVVYEFIQGGAISF